MLKSAPVLFVAATRPVVDEALNRVFCVLAPGFGRSQIALDVLISVPDGDQEPY